MKGIILYDDDFLKIKEDREDIEESITRILLTEVGERVMNPLFGCKLKRFLFSPENVLQSDIKREIKTAINRWEPRVEILDIFADILEIGTVTIKLYLVNKITLEKFTYEKLINY